ncbi:MAG: VWA domain-containing protein [Candidatus Peribacteria bacterium]|jgi:hypothetical protein|nr:VWA domain-containing protein [Candidatus Peribacteria bacterium]
MDEKENKLNLPAIRKTGTVESRQQAKSISKLDLNKKTSVASIIKTESVSAQKDVFESEKGLDLVLVGDLTGSMASYHQLLKNKFVDLCNDLFPLIENLKIGIIFYLDHGSGDPYVTRIHLLTSSSQELINFIKATSTGHGGDADEAVEDALYDLLQNMNWKASNSHSVVIFGDASPHPVNHCPSGYDFFILTQKLFNQQITINSVFCGHYNHQYDLQKLQNIDVGNFKTRLNYLDPSNFFSWIANVTGGMIIGVERIDDLLDIIMAAAAKDSGHLDDLEEKLRATVPNKLKFIEIARKAEQRKHLGGSSDRKLLK